MSARVRWGILSTAAINDHVLEGCASTTELEFVAVASRDLAKARSWAEARGIPKAYGSYEALLHDPEIEAVYISVPNSMHIEWAARALQAGKHVLCEKPLSRYPRAVEGAFDVAERAEKLLVEAFMYRFHPQTAEVRKLIGEGLIGELRLLRATLSFSMADPAADVRSSAGLDGGALMDVGCYCVSAFRLFAGEPRSVSGQAITQDGSIDIGFTGTLATRDGTTGQFDCAMHLPRRDALELIGADGVIFVPDPWHCRGAPFQVDTVASRMEVAVDPEDAYRAEFEAVSRAIRGEGVLEFGREDAVAQAAVMQALAESAKSGSSIQLPPATLDPSGQQQDFGRSRCLNLP
jgi:D-xylose 1-dehydrogenase (NADP+, D-xylono-1,5-lactone-forming)